MEHALRNNILVQRNNRLGRLTLVQIRNLIRMTRLVQMPIRIQQRQRRVLQPAGQQLAVRMNQQRKRQRQKFRLGRGRQQERIVFQGGCRGDGGGGAEGEG